jgi:hypothetical protein
MMLTSSVRRQVQSLDTHQSALPCPTTQHGLTGSPATCEDPLPANSIETVAARPGDPAAATDGPGSVPSTSGRERRALPAALAFQADSEDHCETCLEAYRDVAPLLHQLARRLGKAPAELRIYDPYFCAGSAAAHLATLGFTNVYNRYVLLFRAALVLGRAGKDEWVCSDHEDELKPLLPVSQLPYLVQCLCVLRVGISRCARHGDVANGDHAALRCTELAGG